MPRQPIPSRQSRTYSGALVPGARFVALDSNNHVLLADEPAWPHFLTEIESFLATTPRNG